MSTAYPQVGGSPLHKYAPPAYRMYDSNSVALATFFGSPLAGTVLMASNYRKLGQGSNSTLALVLGAAASAGLVWMGATIYGVTVTSNSVFVLFFNSD